MKFIQYIQLGIFALLLSVSGHTVRLKLVENKMNELWENQTPIGKRPRIEEKIVEKIYNSQRALIATNKTISFYQKNGYAGFFLKQNSGDETLVRYSRFSAHNDGISKTNPSIGPTFSINDSKKIPKFQQYRWIDKTVFDITHNNWYGGSYDEVEKIVVKEGPIILKLKEKSEFFEEAIKIIHTEKGY